jgi:hypothetical protein
LIFWQDRTLQGIHTYVMETLRPLIVEYTGDDRIFLWQDYDTRVKRRRYIAAAQAIPMDVLFPAASLVALVVVIPRLDSFGYWVAWALGLLAFATLVSCWIVKVWRPACEYVERLEGQHGTGGAAQVATGP